MRLDLDKLRKNVKEATTTDLLDRVTIWRQGMESQALELIESELDVRGVGPADLQEHAKRRSAEMITTADGFPAVCYLCHRAAIERRWVWRRFMGLVPMFPRRAYVCDVHRPRAFTFGSRPVPHPPE
jgi:hypothetical protein